MSAQDDPPDAEQPIELPLDGTLDLHTFQPRDVASVVESFIEACQERGILQLRIIHGKGVGVQRARVGALLAKHPAVRAFRTAAEDAGGWGATLVDLHNRQPGH